MQDIIAWLQSTMEFSTGVQLYKKYGKNTFFKDLLKAGPTTYNTNKLVAELQALAPVPAIKLPVESSKLKVEPARTPAPSTDRHQCRPINKEDHARYLRISEQRKVKYEQLKRNMAALDFSTDQSTLHHTAKQILLLDRQIKELWMLTDHYDDHGTFPEVKPAPIEKSITQKIQLLQQSISKAKARLKNPNCRDYDQTKKLIKIKQEELLQLQKEAKRK